jgi:hypothetical protein
MHLDAYTVLFVTLLAEFLLDGIDKVVEVTDFSDNLITVRVLSHFIDIRSSNVDHAVFLWGLTGLTRCDFLNKRGIMGLIEICILEGRIID